MEKVWKKKEVWTKRNETFAVEVSRHEALPYSVCGKFRWCVYAYLYPNHPLFSEIKSGKEYDPPICDMPLHGGCSFLDANRNDSGGITSWKIGCDYNHLGDDHYTHMETKDDAMSVFMDAERLITYLSENKNKGD